MSDELQVAYEECLAAIKRGQSLEQALAQHEEYAEELGPLLLLTDRTRRSAGDQPSRAAFMRSKTDMLNHANQLQTSARTSTSFAWLRWSFAAFALGLLVFITGGLGLAVASAQSLPGDGLYPVKRSAERLQLSFTAGRSNRLNLTISQEARRIEEVLSLLNLSREVEVEFEAVLSEQKGARWQFGEIPVLVTSERSIPSGLRVGDTLVVRGRTTAQGWVRAYSISAAGLTFDGQIEMMKSGQWIVAGRSLVILPSSVLDTNLAMGDLVRVHASTEGEILVAQRIVAIDPAATPIPTLVPSDLDTDQMNPTSSPDITDDENEAESEFDDDTPDDENEREETPEFDDERDGDDDSDEGDDDESPDGNQIPIPATEEPEDDSDDEAEEESDEFDEAEESGQQVEFEGVVQSINGNIWLIGSNSVQVDSETRFEGDPQEGDQVDVKAEQLADGTLRAKRIERDD